MKDEEAGVFKGVLYVSGREWTKVLTTEVETLE
jgi:hypothetical protein